MAAIYCDNARCERCRSLRVAELLSDCGRLLHAANIRMDAPTSERGAQGFVWFHRAAGRIAEALDELHDACDFRGCE